MVIRLLKIFFIPAVFIFALDQACVAAKSDGHATGGSELAQSAVALKSSPKTISVSSPLVIAALKPSDLAKASGMIGKKASVVGVVEKAYSPTDHHIVYLDF